MTLSDTVLEFEKIVRELVRSARDRAITRADTARLAEFVAVEEFERIGTCLERMTWPEYLDFLLKWASASQGFDTTIRRVSELPGLVYFEIEERHRRDDGVAVVNSLSVYEFTEAGKIRHLDVYLQQPR